MEDGPSMGLFHTIYSGNISEWILFGMTRDKCTGITAFISPNNAIKNKN